MIVGKFSYDFGLIFRIFDKLNSTQWALMFIFMKKILIELSSLFLTSGPFTFTYNRGHGECKNPVSNIDSCTEDSRLLLSFQACPDVSGTESTGT